MQTGSNPLPVFLFSPKARVMAAFARQLIALACCTGLLCGLTVRAYCAGVLCGRTAGLAGRAGHGTRAAFLLDFPHL